MTPNLDALARSRAAMITQSLARHRLVFVQMGAAFECMRDAVIAQVGRTTTVAKRTEWTSSDLASSALVIVDLEHCAASASGILGEVRERIFSVMDAGGQVCLISRAPRIAYQSVAGSSVLEDSALVSLPLIAQEELGLEHGSFPAPGWKLPSVTFGAPLTSDSYLPVLAELGQGLVAALDHALFEVNPKGPDGLTFLAARELEGLRGAGLIELESDGKPNLTEPGSLKLLREAVATHISATVSPAAILVTVTAGLWFIERKIRSEVRAVALQKFGPGWRSSCLGGLNAEVLRRAQLDTNVAAKSVADLRDPLEWLTLGELMELVRSEKYGCLGVEPAIWRKLQEHLVPVRNRLAHVRMLKGGDDETVSMWASLIKSRFGE